MARRPCTKRVHHYAVDASSVFSDWGIGLRDRLKVRSEGITLKVQIRAGLAGGDPALPDDLLTRTW